MGDAWETLRSAVKAESWATVVDALLGGLQLGGPFDLLPLLNGALGEVIRREEEADALRARRHRASGRSAFSRLQEPWEPQEAGASAASPSDPGEDAGGARRWRRTLRAVLTADGAAALLHELLARFSAQEFVWEAERLNQRMLDQRMSHEQKAVAIADLKWEHGQKLVVPHYGFTADQRGLKEAEVIIDGFSKSHKEIRKLNGKLNKQIIDLFPNLR